MIFLDLDTEKHHKIPDFLFFLVLIDPSYPERPPKLLTKSNVRSHNIFNHSSRLRV